LDSSEFNLRAHQKLLNALVADQLKLYRVFNMLAADVSTLLEMQVEDAELWKEVTADNVRLVNVSKEEDPPDYRVDWGFYHQEVQKDKDEIERLRKEEEERAKAELEKAKAEADEKDIEKRVEEVKQAAIEAGNDPEEVAEEAEKLLRETKQVADEAGKMMRGEPFDEEVIEEAQRKIIEDEKEHPEPEGDFPKGASIFGG